MTRRTRNLLLDQVLHMAGLGATLLGLLVLTVLLFDILTDGLGRISWDFLTSFPSRRAENAGIFAALTGTVWVITLTAALAVPARPSILRSTGRRTDGHGCWRSISRILRACRRSFMDSWG